MSEPSGFSVENHPPVFHCNKHNWAARDARKFASFTLAALVSSPSGLSADLSLSLLAFAYLSRLLAVTLCALRASNSPCSALLFSDALSWSSLSIPFETSPEANIQGSLTFTYAAVTTLVLRDCLHRSQTCGNPFVALVIAASICIPGPRVTNVHSSFASEVANVFPLWNTAPPVFFFGV